MRRDVDRDGVTHKGIVIGRSARTQRRDGTPWGGEERSVAKHIKVARRADIRFANWLLHRLTIVDDKTKAGTYQAR